MANNITEPDVGSEILIPAGIVYFNPWDSNDVPQGFLDLGENEEFTLTFEAEDPIERKTRRNSAREVIFSKAQGISRGGGITSLSITTDNLLLFLSATKSTETQTATPVTNEEIYPTIDGRIYLFGLSASNKVGVKGVTSVTLTNYPSTIANWAATTAYAIGDYVQDTGAARIYRASAAGTSAGTEPAAFGSSSLGDEVTDGTVTWIDVGAKTAMVAGTDYLLDDTEETGGRFQLSNADIGAVFAAYTPVANSFTRLSTGDTITKTGSLRFVADNDGGTNGVWTLPKVNLTPGGDLSFLNDGTEFQQLPFTIEALKLGSFSVIYHDGVPV